ncbi:VOC family protein [Nocardia aurantiaca]|uniref:Extradiol dioxygenase n=1 Tax=Nocardia aurantiaca TaxID=2675850 RepID=A0A6I3L5T8_9NOCA|nr:VOC family protein [Nocardia aurantiaca]MTE16300.1 extradiol dioxygenase [Nocardia aurantiaca]
MIAGAHTILYAEDAEAARAFFRDTLGLAYVDANDGWLIFKSPPAELAVHPAAVPDSGRTELYLMCDDLAATMDDLHSQGIEFTSEVITAGWGLLTMLKVPGAGEIGLYQPRHATACDLA